jgi:hypothetical protein
MPVVSVPCDRASQKNVLKVEKTELMRRNLLSLLDQRRFPGLENSAVIIAEPVENVETGLAILSGVVKNMLCGAW